MTSSAIQQLLGDKLIGNQGETVTTAELADRVVALYFSAHWCHPCRNFTPLLAKAYEEAVKQCLPFELVFVSNDQDDALFAKYFGTHPWKAIPFEEEDRRKSIGEKFDLSGIPTVIVLDKNGNVITKLGRLDIQTNGVDAIKAWIAKN